MSLTAIGFLGVWSLLPPLFALSDAIWISCFVVPILALNLSFATMGQVVRQSFIFPNILEGEDLDYNSYTFLNSGS